MQLVRQKSKTLKKALSLFIMTQLTLPSFSQDRPLIGGPNGLPLGSDYANPGFGELGGPDDPFAPDEATKQAIMKLPTVQGAVAAIGGLNSAMEQAAQNPNEEWRREKVRQAIRAVPPAVQALAGSFASHMMGNSALPFVLSMMGGFVDVNAPKAFDKFLKNPSPDLIPKLGSSFPKGRDYSDVSITVKEEAPKVVAPPTGKVAPGKNALVTDLAPVGPSTQIVVKETAKEAPASREVAASASPASEETSSVVSSLTEDIAIVESALQQAQPASYLVAPVLSEEAKKALEEKKEEEEEFFAPKEKKEEKKETEAKRKLLKPTSKLLAPLFWLGAILGEQEAFGAETTPVSQDAFMQQLDPRRGNGLQDGGGTPQNPGDESGSQAAQMIFGAAALASAFAPMQVAQTESQKEQAVAQIKSEAKVAEEEIKSNTQKELSDLSSQTALKQAQNSKDIAQINNAAQMERLQINLLAAQEQRNEDRQIQREQLLMQQYAEAQKLALAERQLEITAQLAKDAQEAKNLGTALGQTQAPSRVTPSMTEVLNDFISQDITLAGKGDLSKPRTQPAASRMLLSAALVGGESNQISEKLLPASAKANRGLLSRKLGRRGLLSAFQNKKISQPLSNGKGLYRNGSLALVMGSFSEKTRKKEMGFVENKSEAVERGVPRSQGTLHSFYGKGHGVK